jgi:hypothetical protein
MRLGILRVGVVTADKASAPLVPSSAPIPAMGLVNFFQVICLQVAQVCDSESCMQIDRNASKMNQVYGDEGLKGLSNYVHRSMLNSEPVVETNPT